MTIGALKAERRNTNPRRDVETERKGGGRALPSEPEPHDQTLGRSNSFRQGNPSGVPVRIAYGVRLGPGP